MTNPVNKLLKERKMELFMALLVLVLVGPILYKQLPVYLPTPDILYVKAKVMQVLRGNIFADPITGYDTMHPPLYHLVLAPFKALGLGTDFGLVVVTIFNVAGLMFFTFKIIETVFDRETGFCTALMIPFIIEFMGCRSILLATSFYFSLPFYLAGLWIYFRSEASLRMSAIAAILWGIAFLLSPVYVFLLGLTFLHEALIKKRLKRFFVMVGAFVITIIPFFVQAIYIYSKGLWGSQVFSLWRGFPGFSWFQNVLIEFISPTNNMIISVPAVMHAIILIAALMAIIRNRKAHWLIPLAMLAYFLTFYHFSDQYAIRIQVPLSIFIVATAISGVKRLAFNRYIWIIPATAIAAFSLYHHYSKTIDYYFVECNQYTNYHNIGEAFWQNMDKHMEKDRYIFCKKKVYLAFIMPHFSAHTLGAYKTMHYFQLNAELADMLEYDYQKVITSEDYDFIEKISRKYGIETMVMSREDMGIAMFETLAEHWTPVYSDKYFAIFKKPPGG
jgi:hypothetical protein